MVAIQSPCLAATETASIDWFRQQADFALDARVSDEAVGFFARECFESAFLGDDGRGPPYERDSCARF